MTNIDRSHKNQQQVTEVDDSCHGNFGNNTPIQKYDTVCSSTDFESVIPTPQCQTLHALVANAEKHLSSFTL